MGMSPMDYVQATMSGEVYVSLSLFVRVCFCVSVICLLLSPLSLLSLSQFLRPYVFLRLSLPLSLCRLSSLSLPH